jgi:hypothetical protein
MDFAVQILESIYFGLGINLDHTINFNGFQMVLKILSFLLPSHHV